MRCELILFLFPVLPECKEIDYCLLCCEACVVLRNEIAIIQALRRETRDRYCPFPPTEWSCSVCPSQSGRPRKVPRGWPGSAIDGRNLPHQPPAGRINVREACFSSRSARKLLSCRNRRLRSRMPPRQMQRGADRPIVSLRQEWPLTDRAY